MNLEEPLNSVTGVETVAVIEIVTDAAIEAEIEAVSGVGPSMEHFQPY